MKTFLLGVVSLLASCLQAFAATYTVTRTADDTSPGSLRWAITQANANAGYDIIAFNIANSGGNTFETSGSDSWALITLGSALPIITETVLIDGTTQLNTNTGFVAGRTVGVDGFVQADINYPDVYIVCNYSLPNSENSLVGNGLFINASNVTIRGLAISGFGNTNTTQASAVGHADIAVRYSTTARVVNTVISDCFISCNPRGNMPSPAARVSKSGSILVLGNNNTGTIQRNYIAHPGGYGIVFHGTVDNSSSTPSLTKTRGWTIQENQFFNIGTSTTYTAAARAADAISMMCVNASVVRNNYIENWEQFAIDLGHNTDSNRVENNTITGFTKTTGSAPCGGIATRFSSQRDTVMKNLIFNNTSANNLAGIWTDESITSFTGGAARNDSLFVYSQNTIFGNTNSGIVLSSNGTGSVTRVLITQNSIYNNTGLGIDLNYPDLVGPTQVSPNDNGDGDAGTNTLLNFPLIDSARITAGIVYVWGKAPAGSTIEFFIRDNQSNQHGGFGLNYGEGRTFIGSGVEGSGLDGAIGTGSYNVDGSVAVNNQNLFAFALPYVGFFNTDSITSTATLNGNTSEFGPRNFVQAVLDCDLVRFSGQKSGGKAILNWEALCSRNFSYFELEYSADGNEFKRVGTIVGRGEGMFRFTYDHYDMKEGRNYYRLKMINRDHSYKYSAIVALSSGAASGSLSAHLANNPFVGEPVVWVDAEKEGVLQLNVVNAGGATIITQTANVSRGRNLVRINGLSRQPAGTYQLLIVQQQERVTLPMVKQ